MKGDTYYYPVASRLGVHEGAIGQWTVQAKGDSIVYIGVATGGFDPNTITYINKDWWGIQVLGSGDILHWHAGQEKKDTELQVSLPVEVVVTVDSKKGDGNKWSDDIMCC